MSRSHFWPKAIIFLFTLTLTLSAEEVSAQTMSLTLADAHAQALENNQKSKISALEIEKAEKVVRETLAIGLPQVNAQGSFQNFLDIPVNVIPDFISPSVYGVLITEGLLPAGAGGEPGLIPAAFGVDYTMSGEVTLNQLLFNGSYLIGLKAAKSYVEMSQLQKTKSDVDVKEQVSEAYHTVLLAQENARVLGSSISTLEKMLADISALYEEGFVEEQDVQQMQLTVNTLKSQKQNAERQEGLTKMLLNFQIGQDLETDIQLLDDLNTLTSAPDIQQLVTSGTVPDLLKHPDMRIVDQGILLQDLRIREQKSQYLPSLNGFFNHSQNAQRNEFNFLDGDEEWFPSTVWGVSLQLPIFSSGMKSAKVKQLEIELEQNELQRELTEDALALTAASARSDYLFAQEQYDMEQENVALAKSIRDKTRIKYQEGISSSIELNETENQFIQAQSRSLQASMSLLNALTQLKKAYNLL